MECSRGRKRAIAVRSANAQNSAGIWTLDGTSPRRQTVQLLDLFTSFEPYDDASARWAEFAALVFDDAGLTDHGSSIGSAWLTDDGKLMLRFLEDLMVPPYDGDLPDWVHSMTMEEAHEEDRAQLARMEAQIAELRQRVTRTDAAASPQPSPAPRTSGR